MQSEVYLTALGAGAAGLGISYAFFRLKDRALRAERMAQEQSLREQLRREGEAAGLAARVAAQEQLSRERLELEKALASRGDALVAEEQRLGEREAVVDRQLDRFAKLEQEFRERAEVLETTRTSLETERQNLRQLTLEARARLESVAQLDTTAARTLLLKEVERESAKEAADLNRHQMEDVRRRSEIEAKRILAIALQRCAATQTFESTTATVALTGDDMKGRIIGREGRNIRAFEAATGVTVLVVVLYNSVFV